MKMMTWTAADHLNAAVRTMVLHDAASKKLR
jgi:hypothetical protein